MKAPIDAFKSGIKGIWEYIEAGMTVVLFIIIGFLLLMAAPMLEVITLIFKFIKKLIATVASFAKGILLKANRRTKKAKNYWDESHKFA